MSIVARQVDPQTHACLGPEQAPQANTISLCGIIKDYRIHWQTIFHLSLREPPANQ